MITRKVNHLVGTGRNLLFQCLQETDNEWECVEIPPRKSNKGIRTIKFTRNEEWKVDDDEFQNEQNNIRVYTDFVNSLDNRNIQSRRDYENDELSIKILKKFILGLLLDKDYTVGVRITDSFGEIKPTGFGKRIHKNILWIKDNLDIWDITELPYDDNGYHIFFEFKWRSGNELEKKIK